MSGSWFLGWIALFITRLPFQSMEAPILRQRRDNLKKLLEQTEKEIAEYEKKGI